MADKAHCDGCDSYSSSVLAGFREQGQCPFCGFPAEAQAALTAARERGADEALVQRCAAAEKRAQEAEDRGRRATAALRQIQTLVAEGLAP